jgi:hypothetical protein
MYRIHSRFNSLSGKGSLSSFKIQNRVLVLLPFLVFEGPGAHYPEEQKSRLNSSDVSRFVKVKKTAPQITAPQSKCPFDLLLQPSLFRSTFFSPESRAEKSAVF